MENKISEQNNLFPVPYSLFLILVLCFSIGFLFKNNAEKIFLCSVAVFLIFFNFTVEFLLKKLHPNKKSQMFIGVVMGSMLFKMVFISFFALVFYKKHPDTSTYVLVALMFQYLLLTVFSILRLQKIVLNN